MRATFVLSMGLALVVGLTNCSHCDDPCLCTGILCSTGVLLISGPVNTLPAVTELANNDYVVDFGAVALGMEWAGSLTFENTGAAPLQILSVGSPTDPEFGLTLAAGTTIIPGATAMVPFTFKPFSAGGKSATVVIHTDSTVTPTVTLNLGGLGVEVKLYANPSDVDFGGVVMHTSRTIVITLTNDSSLDIMITPDSVQGADASLFNLDAAPGTPITLPANSAISLNVTFSPLVRSTSTSSAHFDLFSSLGGIVIVGLRGIAVPSGGLCVSPNPLSFGFVQPGWPKTLALHLSDCGDTNVAITFVSIMETDGFAAFSVQPVTAALTPGQAIDVPVTCTPTGSGPYSAELDIVTDSGTLMIPLSC